MKTITVKINLINKTRYGEELLIRINIDSPEKYSYHEMVELNNIDQFMSRHIEDWFSRGYKVIIDPEVYKFLKEAKKIYTKEMLRIGSIIDT